MPAHKRVRLVPRHDTLAGLDGDDFPQRSRLDDLFHLAVEGGKPEHKTDHHAAVFPAGKGLDFQHLPNIGRDRFLQQHVVAGLEGPAAVAVMVVILRGDDHHVGDFSRCQNRVRAGETAEIRAARDAADFLDPRIHRIRAGDDLEAIGPPRSQRRVGLCPRAAADAGDCQRSWRIHFMPQ